VGGPEWCERAGSNLPGAAWRTTIVLAANWRGFAASQPLDEFSVLVGARQGVLLP
jgi:hypothetical protein